jgi:hypothetical protein
MDDALLCIFFALQLIVVLVEKKCEVNMGNFGKK